MSDDWSISIKTVGGKEADKRGDFSVTVSPDDDLKSLHDQIEDATGLTASQQRLIYRGRLISTGTEGGSSGAAADADEETEQNDSPKLIREISGLCDGHTIHLVPKPVASEPSTPPEAGQDNTTSAEDNDNTNEDVSTLSGTGTASLLAALLGLGIASEDDEDNTDEDAISSTLRSTRRTATAAREQRTRLRRSERMNRRRFGRQASYRLTPDDLVVPDPGSMEPVRQGLMTLHTMLRSSSDSNLSIRDAQTNHQPSSPLDADRQWYRGQWLDCRDTVNQWLEATIVDVVRAEDVVTPRNRERRDSTRRRPSPRRRRRRGQNDDSSEAEIVGADDFDARRRLLLEPCEPDDSDEAGELAGYRERDNNEGVQLLLVHYNGWPHRWDEWIRSDSERIRPFRTRTRHSPSAPGALPTPQSVFNAAPTTYIKDGDDDELDRAALLPELSRVVSVVNDLLLASANPNEDATNSDDPIAAQASSQLPWLTSNSTNNEDNDNENDSLPVSPHENEQLSSDESTSTESIGNSNQAQLNRPQLEALAPLLDRLGRTLVDAAPHVASLASTLPEEDRPAENGASTAVEDSSGRAEEETPNADRSSASTGSGLFSLLSRDSRRRAWSNIVSPGSSSRAAAQEENEEDASIPDYVDFVNGMVNTSRTSSRSGSRLARSSDDGASLLGAYLAAASLSNLASGGSDSGDGETGGGGTLARLLRQRGTGGGGGGGGGGGIDIHIHAIVTTPGGTVATPGGLGLAMLGQTTPSTGGRTAMSSGSRSSREMPTLSPLALNTDNDDLFSDLYSENPQPMDPHGTPRGGASSNGNDSDDGDANNSVETDDTTSEPSMRSRNSGQRLGDGARAGLLHSQSSNNVGGGRNSNSSSRRGSTIRRVMRRAMGRRSRSARSNLDRSFHSTHGL